MHTAYEDILSFVTSQPTLDAIVAYEHSDRTQERVAYLEAQEAQESLTSDEREELREFRKAAKKLEALRLRAQRRLDDTDESQKDGTILDEW